MANPATRGHFPFLPSWREPRHPPGANGDWLGSLAEMEECNFPWKTMRKIKIIILVMVILIFKYGAYLEHMGKYRFFKLENLGKRMVYLTRWWIFMGFSLSLSV